MSATQRNFLLFCLFFFLCKMDLYAQEATEQDTSSLYKPFIEELTNLEKINSSSPKVSVAGFTTSTLRESPGIVTLITSEEIANSGAKDVLDVLRLVPGFDFAFDIMPTLSVRGLGANEGKVLLSVDGQIMNDITVGYSFVMNRLPLNTIDRIEIIRGAGSAIYGGVAGLAVINIISKKAKNTQEIGTVATNGFTRNGTMRKNYEFWAMNKFQNGLELDLSTAWLGTKMTDKDYIGGLYDRFVDNKYSSITSTYINLGIRFKKLDVRYIHNDYKTALPQLGNVKTSLGGNFFSLGYRFDINEKLVLNTKYGWRQQNPLYFTDVPRLPASAGIDGTLDVLLLGNTLDTRNNLVAYLMYKPIDKVLITLGTEGLIDKSIVADPIRTFPDGSTSVQYGGFGAFTEVNFKFNIVNITAGARLDKYANIEPVIVPRLAVTKAFEKIHMKALYTQAFKNPPIQNIQFASNGIIKPERFRLIEFEAGYKLGSNFQITANAFDILIRDFIFRRDLIIPNAGISVLYDNIGNTGTRGIEAVGNLTQKWGYLRMGYSFYQTTQTQPEQIVPRVSSINSGVPAHKLSMQGNFRISKDFSVNPTIMSMTNKFSIKNPVSAPNESREYPEELHISLHLQYSNILLRNLNLGFGCINLLDGQYWFAPWKRDFSSAVNLPFQGREFYIRLSYNIKS